MIRVDATMAIATLGIDAALASGSAVLFGYVGMLTLRRSVRDAQAQRAMRRFGAWWLGLAVYTLLGALRAALGAMGVLDVGLHAAINALTVIPLVILLWGLVSYLAYIYLGKPRALSAATVLHVAILAFYSWILFSLDPVAVRATAWSVPIEYEGGLPGWLTASVLLTILGPTLLAAIGYGSLFFRTTDRDARYRIATTSGGFLLWFGSSAVASVTPIAALEWWPLTARIIGVVATLIILAAYRPPTWLQVRFKIRPVDTSTHDAGATFGTTARRLRGPYPQ